MLSSLLTLILVLALSLSAIPRTTKRHRQIAALLLFLVFLTMLFIVWAVYKAQLPERRVPVFDPMPVVVSCLAPVTLSLLLFLFLQIRTRKKDR